MIPDSVVYSVQKQSFAVIRKRDVSCSSVAGLKKTHSDKYISQENANKVRTKRRPESILVDRPVSQSRTTKTCMDRSF